MLEQLAQHLPEQHRNKEGLLAVATSSQVPLPVCVVSLQSCMPMLWCPLCIYCVWQHLARTSNLYCPMHALAPVLGEHARSSVAKMVSRPNSMRKSACEIIQVGVSPLRLIGNMDMQWRHQLDIFSHALQTGQLDVRAFGLEFLVWLSPALQQQWRRTCIMHFQKRCCASSCIESKLSYAE